MPSASTEQQPLSRYQISYRANRECRLAYAKQYREKNATAIKAKLAQWKVENPEKVKRHKRNAVIKSRYGVTAEDYQRMLEAQNNCCAICGIHGSKLEKNFGIDHCHGTGNVRGLLCHPCNILLGNARDDANVLRAAIEYLERSRS